VPVQTQYLIKTLSLVEEDRRFVPAKD